MPRPAPKSVATPGPFDSKQTALLAHEHEVTLARFSPDGKFLFTGGYDGKVYRWDIPAAGSSDATKTVLPGHHAWIQGLVFHSDGKRLFTGDSWGGIQAWNYADADPKPLWTKADAHLRWMRAMAISPDGALLATCGADRVIKLWSAQDGSAKWESPVQPHDLHSVAFHPKGDLVVGDLMGNATHWDLAAKKPVRQLEAHILYLRPIISGQQEINDVGGIRAMSFSPDGKLLACAGCQPTSSGFFTGKPAIVLLDWGTGKEKQLLQWENADPAEGITLDVIWHPDGYVMAGSSGQMGKGALYSWKPGDKAPFYIDKKLVNCRSLSLHPNGKQLALAQVQQREGQGGNGRHLKQDAEYFGYSGQVRLFAAAGKANAVETELKGA